MQLLVSVRSAAEVGAALSGGADIIDAKEPRRGSLGAVNGEVLTEIVARVPAEGTVSVALGDLASPVEVAAAVNSRRLPMTLAPIYLKLGFAGVSSLQRLETLIATAVAVSGENPASPRVVAVAYADARRAGTASPDTIRRLAARAGATGILLDTHTKDGLGLLSWIEPAALARWIASARSAGLLTAVAGGLGLEDLHLVYEAGADVVGVRGAACKGGREGRISPGKVRALRQRLTECHSGFVQGTEPPLLGPGRETRDPGANSPGSTRPNLLKLKD